MSSLSPAGLRYKITTSDHGNYKLLGNVSESEAGFFRVSFDPVDGFEGSLMVVARADGDDPSTDTVGFGSFAYRVLQKGGVAQDYTALSTDLITGSCTILIPSVGLSVALAVTCTAGRGILYSKPFLGPLSL